jgi:hypothetical protein
MADKPDDLDAVRTVVAALEPFDGIQQERIIRWAKEKLGLVGERSGERDKEDHDGERDSADKHQQGGQHSQDIKTFITRKNPRSDVQFAATVAYFYRFEAPQSERKDAIVADDLQEACRKIGRERLNNPAQTLRNAHQQGLLDRPGELGAFSINTVGENLVAMTLPASSGQGSVAKKAQKKAKKKAKSKAASK